MYVSMRVVGLRLFIVYNNNTVRTADIIGNVHVRRGGDILLKNAARD